MKKIIVIGAGFAGLTVSLRLAQKGFQVELYEAQERVGGLLGTDITSFGISERAANAMIRTEKSEALFKELGLSQSLPLKSAKKRFLFRGEPRTWPLTFQESLKAFFKIFPALVKHKLAGFRPRKNQTLKNWGEQHLGTELTRYLLAPAMQGIYANPIDDLSASLILNPLFKKLEEPKNKKGIKYKGLLTGPGGMQDLVDSLESKCLSLGVKFHFGEKLQLADLAHPVVVATSAQGASSAIKTIEPELAKILARVQMTSLMSTTVFYREFQTKYQGFGCLIPRGINYLTLGILMNSYIFKDRNHYYNETWIMGGVGQEDLIERSDMEIMNLISHERKHILGCEDQVIDFRINRWNKALPYYNLELEKIQQELQSYKYPRGLFLHGNYLSGIGLSKILERSDEIAQKIANEYA